MNKILKKKENHREENHERKKQEKIKWKNEKKN